MAAQTLVPDGPDGPAIAAQYLVKGILSYARWPEPRAKIRLCVVGTSTLTSRLQQSDARIDVAAQTAAAISTNNASCDAIFLARTSPADRTAIIRYVARRPVVTLTDQDAQCRQGAMFCLHLTPKGLSFELNHDAVARSSVRVDPRVLKMSQNKGGGL